MTITCMGCEAYLDDDLYDNPWCQSCIDSYSDSMDENMDNDYLTADVEEVCSLAYVELDLSIFLMPLWDVPSFDHFVALSVRWRFFDRYLYKFTYVEQAEEYAELMLDW